MTRLAVGIPWQHEMMPTQFLFDLWSTDIMRGKDTALVRGYKGDTPLSRNQIVLAAQEWGADELLFLDVDQGFPRDTLARLRSHDKDIVSGLTPTRKYPHHWLAFRESPNGGKANVPIPPLGLKPLEEVSGFGFGCVLIKMSVFDKVAKPWFVNEYNMETGDLNWEHDLRFCYHAKEAGLKLYVDTNVRCTHDMRARIDYNCALNSMREAAADFIRGQKLEERNRIIVPKREVQLART